MNDGSTTAPSLRKGISPDELAQLRDIVGDEGLTLDARQLASGSRDCYHFSPVLVPQLDGRQADVIVYPRTQAELADVIRWAVRHRIPITPRGAGTGNYGQGVPLHGGVLVNMRRLDRLVHLTPDEATVEAGHLLYDIEKVAADVGAELRIFPSTVVTSSTGGFVCGGSGGVGSIEWGGLREGDNVRALRVLTIEEEPRDMWIEGAGLEAVLHNCGVTAIVTEVRLALAPKRAWHQYVITFDTLDATLDAAIALGEDTSMRKRLLTAFEWPIPSFFVPLVRKGACPDGRNALFLYAEAEPSRVAAHPALRTGSVTFHQPPGGVAPRGVQIYDYTWNHTTQWAMKADKGYTYLQDGFAIGRLHAQIAERKAHFPGEVLEHVEFTRGRGQLAAGGLTVVRFSSAERLAALIAFSESIGVRIANPHTYYLDDDSRWYGDAFLAAKQQWDPWQLLNPGHLRALEARG
jgi:FAD/FMN-containing dehydrogenase